MNVLFKAMKIKGEKFESPDLFFDPGNAAYATWGCVVTPAMVKEMGMPSMQAFVDFLDKKGIEKEPIDYMLSREAKKLMATVNDR